MPSIPSVPLISARPSLAEHRGLDPRRRERACRRRRPVSPREPGPRRASPGRRPPAGPGRRSLQRAVLGDDRVDAGLEHRQHRLGEHGPRARAAHRERTGTKEEHRPHHLALDRRAHAGGVRADQRALQLDAAIGGDRRLRERSEPGRHAVGGLLGVGEARDDRGGLLHRRAGLLRQARPLRDATATTSAASTPVSRVERHPADSAEVDLDPRMGVEICDLEPPDGRCQRRCRP